jgi:hypothetical protein
MAIVDKPAGLTREGIYYEEIATAFVTKVTCAARRGPLLRPKERGTRAEHLEKRTALCAAAPLALRERRVPLPQVWLLLAFCTPHTLHIQDGAPPGQAYPPAVYSVFLPNWKYLPSSTIPPPPRPTPLLRTQPPVGSWSWPKPSWQR